MVCDMYAYVGVGAPMCVPSVDCQAAMNEQFLVLKNHEGGEAPGNAKLLEA